MKPLWSSVKKGVTLSEIMIAFIILCVAAIGAAGVISQGHKTTRNDFRRGEALQILVDRMNHLSSFPFKTLWEEMAGSSVKEINSNFRGKIFGKSVTVDKNTYKIIGRLRKQAITFDNLQELAFPNLDYVHNKPETWIFCDKNPKSYSFNSDVGNNAYGVIKITVEVQPLADGVIAAGPDCKAITFVSDTE